MVLGSMVTVAGAGSAALLLPGHGMAAAQTGATASAGLVDPVIGEVRRQLREALTGLQNGSGEAARHAASLFQVWAARINAGTSDSEIRARATRAVRRAGRTAIIDAPINHREMQTHFRALGLSDAQIAQLDLHEPVDPQAKEAALDLLLENGVRPFVDRGVALLQSAAERLDAKRGLVPIAARSDACDDLCLGSPWFKAEMEVACALAALAAIIPAMVVFVEVCAFFASLWLILLSACGICRLILG